MTLLLYSNNTRTAGDDSVDWTRHIYKEKTLPLNNAHLKDGHITTMQCWVRYWYSLITPEPPLILIFIFFLNSPAELLSLILPFTARVKPPVALAPLWLYHPLLHFNGTRTQDYTLHEAGHWEWYFYRTFYEFVPKTRPFYLLNYLQDIPPTTAKVLFIYNQLRAITYPKYTRQEEDVAGPH